MNKTQHYVLGKWTSATGEGKPSFDAVTGEFIAETSVEGLDIPAILHYGRTKGGEQLRKMTFQERGNMLKRLAMYLCPKKVWPYTLMRSTSRFGACSKNAPSTGWPECQP